MKFLLVFSMAIFFTINGFGQIKKVPKLNKTAVVKPVNFSDDQLKTMNPEQLSKIKGITVDREKLMLLKPTASYKIIAPETKDKDLLITSLFGRYLPEDNHFEIHPRFVHDNRNGFTIQDYMTLKFRPQMGKRYRMLIKLEPGIYAQTKVFISTMGENGVNVPWNVNDQFDEILLDFKATHNGIRISNLFNDGERNLLKLHSPLKVKSITLEKLD